VARLLKVGLIAGGFGEYSLHLANALAEFSTVLLMDRADPAAPLPAGTPAGVHLAPLPPARIRQPFGQLRRLATLKQWVAHFQPDVIHAQGGDPWLNLALPTLRKYPLVVTIHDTVRHVGDRAVRYVPQWVADVAHRQGDCAIVHARQLRALAATRFALPDECIHVVPHIALGDGTAAADVPEDPHHVLFFGRIWDYKGLDYLIRAEPLISAQVPDVRIVIAGRGADFEPYRRAMVHPERFIVHNDFISNEQRAELFRRAAVVVLPYIEASQSGVIPLAYAFGKPVVVTDVGGLPEAVEDGRTGFVVPPRDADALASAITRLLQDATLRHACGARGKAKLEAECAPRVVARQTMAVYRAAVAARGRTISGIREVSQSSSPI
jgi:glycosyltransferase involved in cell wall biosynthesis